MAPRARDDLSAAQQLRRTLHTFKGSARMAGAMRLGELAHLMESRLSTATTLAHATPQRFEALDERSRSHRVRARRAARAARPTSRCRGSRASGRAGGRAPTAADAARAGAAPRADRRAGSRSRPVVVPLTPAVAAPAAAPAAAAPPRRRPRPRSRRRPEARMLRVRADTIDRLVNEAGEVAISRARIEGELRALKAQPARAHRLA